MLGAYADRVCSRICEHPGASVLSLGIGHQVVARRLLDLLRAGVIERYVVVDGSPRIIAEFRERLGEMPAGLELIEGYFETFEDDRRFDFVEAGFVLEHVDDPKVVLRRLHGFLGDDGRLFAAVPNARSLHRLLGHHAGLLADVHQLSDADRQLGHQRYFDAPTFKALIEGCGFRVQDWEGLLLKPFTTSQLAVLDLPSSVWAALVRVGRDYPEIANAVYAEASR